MADAARRRRRKDGLVVSGAFPGWPALLNGGPWRTVFRVQISREGEESGAATGLFKTRCQEHLRWPQVDESDVRPCAVLTLGPPSRSRRGPHWRSGQTRTERPMAWMQSASRSLPSRLAPDSRPRCRGRQLQKRASLSPTCPLEASSARPPGLPAARTSPVWQPILPRGSWSARASSIAAIPLV